MENPTMDSGFYTMDMFKDCVFPKTVNRYHVKTRFGQYSIIASKYDTLCGIPGVVEFFLNFYKRQEDGEYDLTMKRVAHFNEVISIINNGVDLFPGNLLDSKDLGTFIFPKKQDK